jgi:hypothetical protein
MPLTRTGVRGEVALDIAVQDFGCLTVPIMAKVYKHSDQSAVHGEGVCFTAACKNLRVSSVTQTLSCLKQLMGHLAP